MRTIVLLLFLMFCSAAVAWTTETSDDKWRSGWGQGVSEAEVTQGSGNKIYVACEDGSGGDSSVSFELVGDGPKSGSEVLLIFDKGKPESISVDKLGRIVSDSYASASSFEYVIAKLKKHLSVYVRYPDGREATFTLKGAAAAIGQCRSTWP